MIKDLLDDIDIENSLIELLEFEKQINEKKIKGDKLSKEEYFFDTYFIKPSSLVRIISRTDRK